MEATDTIERRYWPIGYVAKTLGIAPSRIRFWLDHFKIDVSNRRVNKRLFSKQEVELVTLVKHLVDNRGFTLRGVSMELQAMGYLRPRHYRATEEQATA